MNARKILYFLLHNEILLLTQGNAQFGFKELPDRDKFCVLYYHKIWIKIYSNQKSFYFVKTKQKKDYKNEWIGQAIQRSQYWPLYAFKTWGVNAHLTH